MKIVITGGAGFIGSELGKRLHRAGHEVVLLDDMSFGHIDNLLVDGKAFARLVVRDIRSPSLTDVFAGADTVFHLAGIAPLAVCQSDPMRCYDVNVSGVANVLEHARRVGVRRVVFSSTSAVYEKTKQNPLAESDPIAPDLVYASSKAAAERVCDAFALNYGMDVVIARFFNVFGPHQDIERTSPPLTSYVARELVMGRAPRLFNASGAQRDYVFSEDLVEALEAMMLADGVFLAERFNLCSGRGYSVPELFDIFREVSGRDIEPVYGDPQSYWDAYDTLFTGARTLSRERVSEEVFKNAIGDPTKTRQQFGWTASTSIRAGIEQVYEYGQRRMVAA